MLIETTSPVLLPERFSASLHLTPSAPNLMGFSKAPSTTGFRKDSGCFNGICLLSFVQVQYYHTAMQK